MAVKYETRLEFIIQDSIPVKIESSNGLEIITWPSVVGIWKTLKELKKLTGVGKDQVTQFSRDGRKIMPVKLGGIKQLQQTHIDGLAGAEIVDDDNDYRLVWERYLDSDDIFIAGVSKWNLTFEKKKLTEVLRVTGGIAIESVIEPLVTSILNEVSEKPIQELTY
jgi:hypothetical protein